MKRMCLDIKTKDIKTNDIIWGVLENDHECEQMWIECGTNDYDEVEAQKVKSTIENLHVDIVITMNFCPTVSKACHDCGIPYASWIYDCPILPIYGEEAKRDTNYFFSFDKNLMKEIRRIGLPNVYYLPLAANVTRMGMLEINEDDVRRYSCDVSFVGSGYVENRFRYYRDCLDNRYVAELDQIFESMCGKWDDIDRVHGSMSDELIEAMKLHIHDKVSFDKRGIPYRTYFEEEVVPKAVARKERNQMMSMLVEFEPRWYGYTPQKDQQIRNVLYMPRLSYEEGLPKANYLSRINLSTTLHSITSGLAMRVFDTIGAGGFIITNYQPEAEELFDVGKELVMYHDFNEMKELVQYYLKHENERVKILAAGYKRVCGEYTYPVAVRKIISSVYLN